MNQAPSQYSTAGLPGSEWLDEQLLNHPLVDTRFPLTRFPCPSDVFSKGNQAPEDWLNERLAARAASDHGPSASHAQNGTNQPLHQYQQIQLTESDSSRLSQSIQSPYGGSPYGGISNGSEQPPPLQFSWVN